MSTKFERKQLWDNHYANWKDYNEYRDKKLWSTKYDITKLKSFPVDQSQNNDCKIEIINDDTIEVAKRYVNDFSVMALNMASDYKAGGGVRNGAVAQEECLFLKSLYFLTLQHRYYPLDKHDIVYSPDVWVVRDEYYRDLSWDRHYKMSFLAVAGLRHPKTKNDGYAIKHDRILMEQKIESIFKVAIEKKHDTLVLGALGCGVFDNPPYTVAQIFKDNIDKYKGYFKNIVFAILERKPYLNPIFREVILK